MTFQSTTVCHIVMFVMVFMIVLMEQMRLSVILGRVLVSVHNLLMSLMESSIYV